MRIDDVYVGYIITGIVCGGIFLLTNKYSEKGIIKYVNMISGFIAFYVLIISLLFIVAHFIDLLFPNAFSGTEVDSRCETDPLFGGCY